MIHHHGLLASTFQAPRFGFGRRRGQYAPWTSFRSPASDQTTFRHAPTLGFAPSLHTPTQLHWVAESLSAATAIACPTLLGMKADRLQSGLGALVTILVAAHFSSLGISPTAHRLYEICWSRFLPASLSLLLLTPSIDGDSRQEDRDANGRGRSTRVRKRTRDMARNEILAMSIPFLLGCLGSILGCLLSYFYCWLGKDNDWRMHQRILSGRQHFFFLPGHLLLKPEEAAVAAGCLLSAYIGGSMNYFATARALVTDKDLSFDAHAGAEEVLHGTFGSVASDMLVLPIYYSALNVLSSSRMIRRWFPGRRRYEYTQFEDPGADQNPTTAMGASRKRRAQLVFALAPAVWSIIVLSEAIEKVVPGFGIASISTLSCIASKAISSTCETQVQSEISDMTQQLSDVCYYMLLSVIGVSMNLRKLTLGGHWASSSSAIFALVPLVVHFVTILFGSAGFVKLFPKYRLGIEQILAASNAAICGPFTAAALVGKLSANDKSQGSFGTRWKGFALAATFWGIVGYAVATNIGVSMSKALLSRIG